MRGLLQKDICLLKQRKQTAIIFILIAVMMAFSQEVTFVIGYCTMLMNIFTVSTVSYDEFDNCFPFLMTLPITRREYVKEKYLFMILGGALGWFISTLLAVIVSLIRGEGIVVIQKAPEILILLFVLLVIIAVLFPVQLRFGSEKSRIVLAMLGGGVFVIGMVMSKIQPIQITREVSTAGNLPVLVLTAAVSVLVCLFSYFLSIRIMDNKQF